jgi:hypothetical protein
LYGFFGTWYHLLYLPLNLHQNYLFSVIRKIIIKGPWTIRCWGRSIFEFFDFKPTKNFQHFHNFHFNWNF